jgi:hypothetical protein
MTDSIMTLRLTRFALKNRCAFGKSRRKPSQR